MSNISPAAAASAPQIVASLPHNVREQLNTDASSAVSDVTSLSNDALAEGRARFAAYMKVAGRPTHMGQDASRALDALTSTMQLVMRVRPDLANAKFDFQTDNGKIKVISSSMDQIDKKWLERQLNENSALVAALQNFHDDAVEGYRLWATLDGSADALDMTAVSKAADKKFNFLEIFQRLNKDFSAGMDLKGSCFTTNGTAIRLDVKPNSARTILEFSKAASAIKLGTVNYIDSGGRTHFGVLKGDMFCDVPDLLNFRPNFDGNTLRHALNEQQDAAKANDGTACIDAVHPIALLPSCRPASANAYARKGNAEVEVHVLKSLCLHAP